jgi:hypothetical protein
MSWRGQGGKRAKGRRGDQDPELDNTAWLAELEREAAAHADDDEDDWASTLRGRRPANQPPPTSAPSPPDPGWLPPSHHPFQDAAPGDPAPAAGDPGSGYGGGPGGAGPEPTSYGAGSGGGGGSNSPSPEPDLWAVDPGPQDPASTPDPDWSWRPAAADAFEGSGQADPDPGWERYGQGDRPDPGPEAFGDPRQGAGSSWDEPGTDSGSWSDPRGGGWQSAGVETPTGAWDAGQPLGREPDYPALFGELYRRSAAQQDPIWEAPPAEPLPEQGAPESPSGGWPFEETTQSWEPSDRSFIWPSDELPASQAEWDQPGSASWMDDPQPATAPEPDQTAAWGGPGSSAWEEAAPEPAPEPRSSLWGSQPGGGNGVAPPAPPVGPPATGPPPDDWAAAIPTDVPAARRAADPSATQVWRPDVADAEPGVPLGPGSRSPRPSGGQAPPGQGTGRRATRSQSPAPGAPTAGPAGTIPGTPPYGAQGAAPPGTPGAPPGATRRRRRTPATEAQGGPGGTSMELDEEARAARRMAPVDTGEARRKRPAGERQARAWPRVVAVISWIVLVMVLCWYYVFPWLERVLPENF